MPFKRLFRKFKKNKKKEAEKREEEKQEEKKEEESMIVEGMYTTLSEAKKEIWKRWNDKELRKKVEEYLGEIPDVFKDKPRAALSRSIITPNLELFYFLDLVENIGLNPIGLEGVEDKFCTKNYDKVSLGKLAFFKSKNSEHIAKGRTKVGIIDMMDSDGKRFCDIDTFWGENLVEFHHRMLKSYNVDIETFDDFKWFKKRGKKNNSYQYYENFLTLFLCHGILFENFHANGKEKSFTTEIIINNYKKIKKRFGYSPLIVPIVPFADERNSHFWDSYLST